ncbi:iron chaperone [Streptomyces sp. NPDC093589]|uniref:iron chaperone n=1 Tax=Streptomyces sp. NPDC093589 TaxID=3366043 RepID=UPI0037F25EC4
MSRPQTIDEYIEGFSGPSRELLEQLRALAREAVPQATEAIKWGNPAWVHASGTILFMVSGHTKHANVAFTPSTREAFDADLTDFSTGKGTVKLPYGQPVPGDLLRRMIAFRVREHERDGVLWM